MKEAISASWIGKSNTCPPFARTEERVEVRFLIGMPKETIDLFVHEIYQDFATTVAHDVLHYGERHTAPSERIDECECRGQSSALVRIKNSSKRRLKGLTAYHFNPKMVWNV